MNDGLSHSFTYDAEGNVVQVNGGSSGSYVYGALNQRVSVQTSSGTLEYLFDFFGRRTSTYLTTRNVGIEGRIYWDGKQIAYRGQSGPTWFKHKSVGGTERLRTNYQGTAAATESSPAFGDGFKQNVLNAGGNQDNSQYAGQDYNAESSSQHAMFRQYSSTVGRWMSPDPYDGSYDAKNPQSLNRYAYVLNNPLGLTDPLGLGPQDCENPGDPACAPGPTPDCTPNCVDQYGHPYIPNGNGGIAGGNGGEVIANSSALNDIGISIISSEGGFGGISTYRYMNSCVRSALAKGAVNTALDAIGTLPEGRTLAAAFSLWHGAAGASNGIKILGRVGFAGGLISTMSATHDLQRLTNRIFLLSLRGSRPQLAEPESRKGSLRISLLVGKSSLLCP